jgi:Flp pilus assembly protein CpaB
MVSSSFLRVVLALAVISQLRVLTVAQECDREQAFSLIQEQIAQSKTLEKTAARISVLTQGADLLWPYRQSAARSAFEEAFEVASQGNTPDQRFVVIRAIAQRDSEWARRLAKAIAEEKRSEE